MDGRLLRVRRVLLLALRLKMLLQQLLLLYLLLMCDLQLHKAGMQVPKCLLAFHKRLLQRLNCA